MELDIEGLKRYEPHPRYLKAMRESDDGQYFKCPDVLAVVECLRKQLEEADTLIAKIYCSRKADQESAIRLTIQACVMAIDQEGLKYGDKLMQAKEQIAKRVMEKLEQKNG